MKSRDHSSAEAPPQSDYASAVTRVAVAQICGTVGYGAAEASALAVLTDVTGLYLRAIAKSAASSANSRGRTEANLLDVIASLEELNSVQGFEGASIPTSNALSSSLIRELERFVKYTEETPFAKPLPRNTFFRKKVKLPKRGGVDQYNEGRFRHVPKWLPSVPEIEKEEKGEAKWGFGTGMKEEKESESDWEWKNNRVEREGKEKKNLPVKRIRVKFKLLQKKGRNDGIEQSTAGVCRGGGIGKRVSCENHGDDGKKENKKKKKSSKMAKSMIIPNNLRLSRPSDSMILS
ncbi:PREDICTED: transcription initiation factor TFIID subunit 8 [Ipomoea nil]|uniref:transcription initiation factor TFIID subunit 8 n=1 Tax=Ipomoea nil TaxID=35883 RepID=UPI0009013DA4|nr:PREDICTED: transcription initiation factor TFIID subunit 8 [Ipomoea nil]